MIHLTHFQAMVLFAVIISIAFAFLSKRTLRDRLIYLGWSLLGFLGIAVAIAWILFPLSR